MPVVEVAFTTSVPGRFVALRVLDATVLGTIVAFADDGCEGKAVTLRLIVEVAFSMPTLGVLVALRAVDRSVPGAKVTLAHGGTEV